MSACLGHNVPNTMVKLVQPHHYWGKLMLWSVRPGNSMFSTTSKKIGTCFREFTTGAKLVSICGAILDYRLALQAPLVHSYAAPRYLQCATSARICTGVLSVLYLSLLSPSESLCALGWCPLCMQVYEETAGLCVGDAVTRSKKVGD